MSRGTTNPRSALYEKLKRRVQRFNPSHDYARLLKQAAEEFLADNPIGSGASSAEVAESIKSLLPAHQIVFTKEYFSQPVFPVTLVRDVATLYGCLEIDPLILEEIDAEKKTDSVAMANAWLAHAYNPAVERVLLVLDMYETARIFGPHSLTIPLTPQPPKRLDVPKDPATVPRSVARNDPSNSDDHPQTRVTANRALLGRTGPTTTRLSSNETDIGVGSGDGSQPISQPEQSKPSGDPTKKATAVEQYFRTSKYSGDLNQSLQNTTRDYNVCAMLLELTPKQKAIFIINVFGGTARDYFFEHCRETMSYEELVDIMKRGFDNNARQLAIEAELETLSLDKVMKEKDITDINEGLTKLADKINSLFPRMLIQSQYPKNKVHFLRKAVLDQDWAKASIAQIVTSNFGFDDLLTSFREQYQLEREVQEAKSKNGSLPSTLYQQYGRRPKEFHQPGRKPFANGSQGKKRLNPIGKDGKRMKCSWRGSEEHFVKDCPPGASRNSVRSRLENGISAVHIVHDLVTGIEELTCGREADSDDEVSSQGTWDEQDAPSELHIFDNLSKQDESSGQRNSPGDVDTAFFESIDEHTATNYIASKFAKHDIASPPQVLTAATEPGPDFRKDV